MADPPGLEPGTKGLGVAWSDQNCPNKPKKPERFSGVLPKRSHQPNLSRTPIRTLPTYPARKSIWYIGLRFRTGRALPNCRGR